MNRTFATILVPLEHAQLGAALAATFGTGALAFGWTGRCGAGGVASHYITSGMLAEPFVAALASPDTLRAALAQVVELSEGEAVEIWGGLDVSMEAAEVALERRGMELEASEMAQERAVIFPVEEQDAQSFIAGQGMEIVREAET